MHHSQYHIWLLFGFGGSLDQWCLKRWFMFSLLFVFQQWINSRNARISRPADAGTYSLTELSSDSDEQSKPKQITSLMGSGVIWERHCWHFSFSSSLWHLRPEMPAAQTRSSKWSNWLAAWEWRSERWWRGELQIRIPSIGSSIPSKSLEWQEFWEYAESC